MEGDGLLSPHRRSPTESAGPVFFLVPSILAPSRSPAPGSFLLTQTFLLQFSVPLPASRTLQMPCLLPPASGSSSFTRRPLALWVFFCADGASADAFHAPRPLPPRPEPSSSLPAETFPPALWQPVPWPRKTALGQPGHTGPGPGPSWRSGTEHEQGRGGPSRSRPLCQPPPPAPRRRVCVCPETGSQRASFRRSQESGRGRTSPGLADNTKNSSRPLGMRGNNAPSPQGCPCPGPPEPGSGTWQL